MMARAKGRESVGGLLYCQTQEGQLMSEARGGWKRQRGKIGSKH